MTLENQRPREAHDFYPEGPSASDAVFRANIIPLRRTIYDPAMGSGSIVRMAQKNGYSTGGSDIRSGGVSFLDLAHIPVGDGVAANTTIVTNPPYGTHENDLREAFVKHAFKLGVQEVWILSPLPWIAARLPWLVKHGCISIYVLRPRLSILPHSEMMAGKWPGGGGKDYVWLRFDQNAWPSGPTLRELHRDVELDTPEHWTWWNE